MTGFMADIKVVDGVVSPIFVDVVESNGISIDVDVRDFNRLAAPIARRFVGGDEFSEESCLVDEALDSLGTDIRGIQAIFILEPKYEFLKSPIPVRDVHRLLH